MKKTINTILVILGLIFAGIIIASIYLFIVDPYNIKPILFDSPESVETNTNNEDKNPLLSDTQEKTLETFGVDPASIPSSITPEQEACFTAILGAPRVAEIKAGSSPTATEYFKAKSCI